MLFVIIPIPLFTVQANLEGNYFVSGGGLPSTFKAVQFHFHWGNDNTAGGEHTQNGKTFAAEVRFVSDPVMSDDYYWSWTP